MREELNEPTFGEKMSPVLTEIETAIWEHEINFPDEPPRYTDDGFRAAAKIFMSAIVDKMYAKDKEHGLSADYMEQHAEEIGWKLRNLCIEQTGYDPHNLYYPTEPI